MNDFYLLLNVTGFAPWILGFIVVASLFLFKAKGASPEIGVAAYLKKDPYVKVFWGSLGVALVGLAALVYMAFYATAEASINMENNLEGADQKVCASTKGCVRAQHTSYYNNQFVFVFEIESTRPMDDSTEAQAIYRAAYDQLSWSNQLFMSEEAVISVKPVGRKGSKKNG